MIVLRKTVLVCALLTAWLCLPASAAPAGAITVGGYWENWSGALAPGSGDTSSPAYYEHDIGPFTLVYYAFLTLAQTPNPYSPPDLQWDGQAIYESMTEADVIQVMTPSDPAEDNPKARQRVKIQALIDACHAAGKKFIWAIGGWSDLTRTISDDQIPTFVAQCVALLSLAGDGIDFDWEHLSDHAEIADQQRHVLGKLVAALRQALDQNGLSDKLLGYTTRFNAFWDDASRPAGVTAFISDGEGLDVAQGLAAAGASLDSALDWVNIMLYDVASGDLGAAGTFTLDTYTLVLESFAQHVATSRIVMGFEPGPQVAGGVWEGLGVDKQVIDQITANGYGGIMFWAINETATSPSTGVTGANAQALATYAAQTTATMLPAPLMLLME